jgi:hypothetical protein
LGPAHVGAKAEKAIAIESEETIEVGAEAVVDVVRQIAFRLRQQQPAAKSETGRLLNKNARALSDLRVKQ